MIIAESIKQKICDYNMDPLADIKEKIVLITKKVQG